jgi:hypothetical protein
MSRGDSKRYENGQAIFTASFGVRRSRLQGSLPRVIPHIEKAAGGEKGGSTRDLDGRTGLSWGTFLLAEVHEKKILS